jgi:hypothetical protein
MTWVLSIPWTKSQRHRDHPSTGRGCQRRQPSAGMAHVFADHDPGKLVALATGLEVECELIEPNFSGSSHVPLRAVAERCRAGCKSVPEPGIDPRHEPYTSANHDFAVTERTGGNQR